LLGAKIIVPMQAAAAVKARTAGVHRNGELRRRRRPMGNRVAKGDSEECKKARGADAGLLCAWRRDGSWIASFQVIVSC
jgi:hypothetical protein